MHLLQMLHFIVLADGIDLINRHIKIENMFVTQSHSLELTRLAVGNVGAAQLWKQTARDATS